MEKRISIHCAELFGVAATPDIPTAVYGFLHSRPGLCGFSRATQQACSESSHCVLCQTYASFAPFSIRHAAAFFTKRRVL